MAIFLHVLIAIVSLVSATVAYLAPSQAKLNFTYALVGFTLVSGTYLALISPAHILETCFTGLAYIGIAMVGIVSAQSKLAAATNR